MIHIVFDGVEELLSIEDARALYDQLGEALGVFSPTLVVPIPIETIQPVGIPEREQDEIYQEWRDSLAPEEDVNVWRGIRAITDPVQETPEPCACQGDVSATCTDGENK